MVVWVTGLESQAGKMEAAKVPFLGLKLMGCPAICGGWKGSGSLYDWRSLWSGTGPQGHSWAQTATWYHELSWQFVVFKQIMVVHLLNSLAFSFNPSPHSWSHHKLLKHEMNFAGPRQ